MRFLWALLLFALVLLVQAAKNATKEPPRDCSDAPDKDIKQTCVLLRTMDTLTRKRIARQAMRNNRGPAAQQRRAGRQGGPARQQQQAPPRPQVPEWLTPIPVPPGSRGQVAYHPYDCMTLGCLCPFFAGRMQNGQCVLSNGAILTMAYRKEYRMMTDDERNRWHRALATLKANGEYDRMSREHFDVGVGSGAHSGPGFLPWHREYLKRFEIALRMVDPTVAVPYWDSVMDNYLPDPRDSILFSNLFAGETDFYGNVIQGPFAYWRTLEGRPTILRNLGREGSLLNENQINNVVAQNTIENTLAYTAPTAGCPFPNNYGAIEYIHSNVHLWVGGDMKPPSTSANEPLFFMHHSFVDYLWELWRQLKQPRWLREVAYSPDNGWCTNQLHFSWAYMRPFPYLANRDGLSNSYTDQMYRYAPRATCSLQNPNCGSPYLFCDTRGYPHCVSKVKMNGNCMGFENFDVCYAGRCWWGRCIPGNRAWASKILKNVKAVNSSLTLGLISTSEHGKEEEAPPPKPLKMVAPLFKNCYNRSPCCTAWANQELCSTQAEYMAVYCGASCGVCNPTFNITNADCRDLHPMCKEFKVRGMCTGKSENFMSENCRHSCGLCHVRKDLKCYRNGTLILPDVSEDDVAMIQDTIQTEVRERVKLAKRVHRAVA
ncbi:shTK domain protein [Teladorsagia circumcincta]|uniref:ShTK domain protein n=1 Tax=Teladorsagia circumcincta TaxID=45464 RepID=A0A2G9U9G0_TELCI|nr:shTK domain protein [Teladorsagia circumcincta]